MKWRGGFTYDGQLVVECETCNGTGLYPVTYQGIVIDRDHCHACGGTADDFWDPAPMLQSLFTAAALALAFRLGGDLGYQQAVDDNDLDVDDVNRHRDAWEPNTEGQSA